MVRAWILTDYPENADRNLEHMTDPPQFVDLDQLKEIGVLYWKLDADNWKEEGKLDEISTERGYKYQDEITCSREKLKNYDETLAMFYKEHLHPDEEIRFITDGSGYFDIRGKNDKWIRIECVKGDLIILPAGIYHRFTLDTKDYLKTKRLFTEVKEWISFNRPNDDHPARLQYVKNHPQAN